MAATIATAAARIVIIIYARAANSQCAATARFTLDSEISESSFADDFAGDDDSFDDEASLVFGVLDVVLVVEEGI
jgi:hypothetical protein